MEETISLKAAFKVLSKFVEKQGRDMAIDVGYFWASVVSSVALVGSSPTTSAETSLALFSVARLVKVWSFAAYSRSTAARSR